MGGEELISDYYNSVAKVNQKYKNKATLVWVMRNYAIKHRFNFKAERSDKQSYVLLYKSPKCSWVFKASCKHGTDTFIVLTFNDEHTCSIMDKVFEQQHATIAFVAGITAPKLVNYKRIITPSDIIEDIKIKLGLDIDYIKAWRSKERALKILRRRPADEYKKIPTYVFMLNHKSPDNQFMYLFVALQPFIRGFGFCRSVVVVDGRHMRGPYQGTFILASTLDGADIARSDLFIFLQMMQFKCAFGERDNMCIVSDRHESIIKAVGVIYPCIPHFACIWHLWNNVCTNYRKSKDKLTGEFFAMAKGQVDRRVFCHG
ncbi:uncharacterized protein LOC124898081 [Capsicum annuum]|uniref:uncharacterized protein LOC124898081 n=1 Tax=Capsicum annuum TaxID=4072 RepID=UPI001FB08425|nr:uncharacterized protein LOC124898081 [Capsicum annuum]